MQTGLFAGSLVCETSDRRTLTWKNRDRTVGSRVQAHEIIGKMPVLEFTGEDTPTMRMTVYVSSALGVDPDAECERWMRAARTARTGYFVVDGKVEGGCLWCLTSATKRVTRAGRNGRTLVAELALTMEGTR